MKKKRRTQSALWFVGVSLVLFALGVAAMPPRHAADAARLDLAAAFDRKDMKVIQGRIYDGWSGLRHCASWTDPMWKAAGTALRDARLASDQPRERIYTVTLRWPSSPAPQAREVHFTPDNDGKWRLDLNSFLGPFPHE